MKCLANNREADWPTNEAKRVASPPAQMRRKKTGGLLASRVAQSSASEDSSTTFYLPFQGDFLVAGSFERFLLQGMFEPCSLLYRSLVSKVGAHGVFSDAKKSVQTPVLKVAYPLLFRRLQLRGLLVLY